MGDPQVVETDARGRPRLAERHYERSRFDRLASVLSEHAGRGWFFALCLLLVIVWIPSIAIFRKADTWQLVINTITSIVTFLLVALLQNAQRRSEEALHRKLDAIAEGVADLMEHGEGLDNEPVRKSVDDLRTAVGLDEQT